MASIRYACFLIDTNQVDSAKGCELRAGRLQLLVSSILSSLRDLPSDSGERIPLKWTFRLFDSAYSDSDPMQHESMSTMRYLTAASLIDLSTAMKQALGTSDDSAAHTPTKATASAQSNLNSKSSTSPIPRKRRSSANFGDSSTSFASYFENWSVALSAFLKDLNDLSYTFEDREGEVITTSKSAGENRPSSRHRRSETLVYLVSACPQTLTELMRSIERPHEFLKNQANPLLDPRGALLYAGRKLKSLFGPHLKSFRPSTPTDRNNRCTWIDTREWVINTTHEPSTNTISDYFGQWDRFGKASELKEDLQGRNYMAEIMREYGIGIFSASSAQSMSHLVHPQYFARLIYVHPFSSTSTQTDRVTFQLQDHKFELLLELLFGPSYPLDDSSSYESILTVPIQEYLENHWSRSWIATPTTTSSSKWKFLLSKLSLSSTSLVLAKSTSTSLLLLTPLSNSVAMLSELDWTQSTFDRLSLPSLSSSYNHDSISASQNSAHDSTEAIERAERRVHADIPLRSVFEVLSALGRSKSANSTSSGSDPVKAHNGQRESAVIRSLMFSEDPRPNGGGVSRLLVTPEAVRAVRPSHLVDSPPPVAFDMSNYGLDVGDESDSQSDALEEEELQAALCVYFTEFYAQYLHGRSTFKSQRYTSPPSLEVRAFVNSLPLPDETWSPSQLYISPRAPDSLEMRLHMNLAKLESSDAMHNVRWRQTLIKFVEEHILLSESKLRAKYVSGNFGESNSSSINEILTFMDDEIEEAERTSDLKKLTEHRIQLLLSFECWRWQRRVNAEIGTSIESQSTRKLELPPKTRTKISSLLTNIAFLFSSAVDVEFFKKYLEGLMEILDLEQEAPNFKKWLEKRFALEAATSLALPAVASASSLQDPSPIASLPENAAFLARLIESTSTIKLEAANKPIAPTSARSALTLLTTTSAPEDVLTMGDVQESSHPNSNQLERASHEELELPLRTKPSKRAASSNLDALPPKRKAL